MEQIHTEDHKACLGKRALKRIHSSPVHSPEPSSAASHCKGAHRRKDKHPQLLWEAALQAGQPFNQAHTAHCLRATWNNRRWNCFQPFSPCWNRGICVQKSLQPSFKWSFWLNCILRPLIAELNKWFRCCKSVLCDFKAGLWNYLV